MVSLILLAMFEELFGEVALVVEVAGEVFVAFDGRVVLVELL